MEEVGAQALVLIEQRLVAYPHLQVFRDEGVIKVISGQAAGFDVEAVDDFDEVSIFAGPWHSHFWDAETGANVFIWLLTRWTRICVFEVDSKWVGATIERLEGDTWSGSNPVTSVDGVPENAAGRYLQNDLIQVRKPDWAAVA